MLKSGLMGLALGLSIAAWTYFLGVEITKGQYAQKLIEAQSQTMQAANLASIKESERLRAQKQADSLARELEDLANADVENTGRLPAGRVLRLNRY